MRPQGFDSPELRRLVRRQQREDVIREHWETVITPELQRLAQVMTATMAHLDAIDWSAFGAAIATGMADGFKPWAVIEFDRRYARQRARKQRRVRRRG